MNKLNFMEIYKIYIYSNKTVKNKFLSANNIAKSTCEKIVFIHYYLRIICSQCHINNKLHCR